MRPLVYAPAPPPVVGFRRTRDPMKHVWAPRAYRGPVGVADMAYDTFAAPVQSIVGAGSGRGNSVISPGQPPMVVHAVVQVRGSPTLSGQFVNTPLSDPIQG